LVAVHCETTSLRGLADVNASGLAPNAGFAGFDEKRTTIRLALDHLFAHAPHPRKSTPLPENAPFGTLKVDREACTLCMGCVAVCPASALSDGDDLPQLRFTEANCVQCGLCARACPEDAIQLVPKFTYDSQQRAKTQVLNEEEPFLCVECGKPFATQSMMRRMQEKLKGHWMYQDSAALRRLSMCEDCRVKSAFTDGGGWDAFPDRGPGGGGLE
ncbi:MAG: 4Fe-4S binding protein, partial [Gammaproteobacteria bacterium]|nr:4Fe-4S binding protein [Gammaproteobacteria bacterium]